MRSLTLATGLIAVALCTPAGFAQDDVAKLGLRPSYEFTDPVDNGFGVKSLASLRGTPTLVEFWGTY